MPYRVTYALDPTDRTYIRTAHGIMLDLLTAIDAAYLRRHPEVPPLDRLLASGRVRPEAAPKGQEEWQDVATTLKRGAGDVEDLAAWRAAETWARTGRMTRPVVPSMQDYPVWNMPEEMGTGRYLLALDLFDGERERELSRVALGLMLEGLYQICLAYLRRHPDTPSIYESNLLYMEEPTGQEEWQDPAVCRKMGIFDCEDGACWRAAELTLKGMPSRPFFTEHKRPSGSYLYHIKTKRADGRVEDPSLVLGMR